MKSLVLTQEDINELRAMSRRSAVRQLDAIDRLLSDEGLHPDDAFQSRFDEKLGRQLTAFGYVITVEPLGPRGGYRSVIRTRLEERYRCGWCALQTAAPSIRRHLTEMLGISGTGGASPRPSDIQRLVEVLSEEPQLLAALPDPPTLHNKILLARWVTAAADSAELLAAHT